MRSFDMNGIHWQVKYVSPSSPYLVDRTGRATVATTDPDTHCVYISRELTGDFLNHVVTHELGHCVMFSYGLIHDIHAAVDPQYWVDAEEWVCNFVADYGREILNNLRDILGDDALDLLPKYLTKLVS